MRARTKLVQLSLMLFTTVVLLVFVSFAWFATLKKTDPIIITTGSLKIEVNFYQGIDANLDGELDNNEYIEVVESGLSFTNVIPGQIYTFKLKFKNDGSTAGILDVAAIIAEAGRESLKYFEVQNAKFIIRDEEIIYLNSNLEENLIKDWELKAGIEVEFFFQIKIKEDLPNSTLSRSLRINYFNVKLEQKR